jgi:hypothetical protein
MTVAIPLSERRYIQTTDAHPKDVLGVGKRTSLGLPRHVRVLAHAPMTPWPRPGTLITTACDRCHAIDVRTTGLVVVDRADYVLGDDGRCGACHLPPSPYRGYLEEIGTGPRNALVEDLETGERYVRPFRGLQRTH